MKKLTGLAAGVLAVLALVVPSSAAAHGFPRHCGDQNTRGYGWYNLEAYRVACSTAREVAKNHTHGRNTGDWKCDDDQIGPETSKASCTRNKNGRHQHLRFVYGA